MLDITKSGDHCFFPVMRSVDCLWMSVLYNLLTSFVQDMEQNIHISLIFYLMMLSALTYFI